jgi:von Willebrand factor type A domain
MRKLVFFAVLFSTSLLMAAGPDCATPEAPLVFRAEAAEVHLTFTAVGERNQLVTDLSSRDFKLLRDGVPVEGITSFENLKDAPLSLIILSDVSESMQKMLPVENLAKAYLSESLSSETDQVTFLDFGAMVHPAGLPGKTNAHLTSMYDSAMATVLRQKSGMARSAVLLISDGGDNYSLHTAADVVTAAQERDVAFYVLNTDPWNESGGRALRTLAERTGGRYYEVEKRKQVLGIVQEIESELRNTYMVTFRVDGTRNGPHQLALAPVERSLRFFYRTTYYQPNDRSRTDASLLAVATR